MLVIHLRDASKSMDVIIRSRRKYKFTILSSAHLLQILLSSLSASARLHPQPLTIAETWAQKEQVISHLSWAFQQTEILQVSLALTESSLASLSLPVSTWCLTAKFHQEGNLEDLPTRKAPQAHVPLMGGSRFLFHWITRTRITARAHLGQQLCAVRSRSTLSSRGCRGSGCHAIPETLANVAWIWHGGHSLFTGPMPFPYLLMLQIHRVNAYPTSVMLEPTAREGRWIEVSDDIENQFLSRHPASVFLEHRNRRL